MTESLTPTIVPMADGRQFEIHPFGYRKVRGRAKVPAHRIYMRVRSEKPVAMTDRGQPVYSYSLRRVLSQPIIDEVAARFRELHAEARRELKRQYWMHRVFGRRIGNRLLTAWRWIMVFIDKMRTAWKQRVGVNTLEYLNRPARLTLGDVANIAWNANKKYNTIIGDSTIRFEDCYESMVRGVVFLIENPAASDADSHENWLRDKQSGGWVYGTTKDEVAKTHPCMVPYHELPAEQKRKDALFIAIVRALTAEI